MHFVVDSPVIIIIMLNRDIYQILSKRFVTHQKVKCVYNASILYKVFTICYLIVHWFNCEELWDLFLPLQSFVNVMWNSVQSLKSLIFISETQETMHLTQLWIIEEEIDTSLYCSRVVKSQCSTIISVILERIVVYSFRFTVQFWDYVTCLIIIHWIRTLNCFSHYICNLLKDLNSNRWWSRQKIILFWVLCQMFLHLLNIWDSVYQLIKEICMSLSIRFQKVILSLSLISDFFSIWSSVITEVRRISSSIFWLSTIWGWLSIQ